jgi:quinol monooxygenase YgiN
VPKVAAIAKLTATAGKRDDLLSAMAELVAATEDEPGTELYVMNAAANDADAVWFYEIYTDDGALAAHSSSDAMKRIGAKLAGLVAGPMELHVLRPVAGKGISV